MAKNAFIPAFTVELRDVNGARTVLEFTTRNEFRTWCETVSKQMDSDDFEDEIMLIVCAPHANISRKPTLIYTSLCPDAEPINMERIIAYLS